MDPGELGAGTAAGRGLPEETGVAVTGPPMLYFLVAAAFLAGAFLAGAAALVFLAGLTAPPFFMPTESSLFFLEMRFCASSKSLPMNIFRVPMVLGVDDVLARAATGVAEEEERVLCELTFDFISRMSRPLIVERMDIVGYSV